MLWKHYSDILVNVKLHIRVNTSMKKLVDSLGEKLSELAMKQLFLISLLSFPPCQQWLHPSVSVPRQCPSHLILQKQKPFRGHGR